VAVPGLRAGHRLFWAKPLVGPLPRRIESPGGTSSFPERHGKLIPLCLRATIHSLISPNLLYDGVSVASGVRPGTLGEVKIKLGITWLAYTAAANSNLICWKAASALQVVGQSRAKLLRFQDWTQKAMANLGSPAATGRGGPTAGGQKKSRIVKRSIVIAGHKTSISLEDDFWQALKGIAARRNMRLSELVTSIDAGRVHTNLSSAIRLFVLDFYRLEVEAIRAREPARRTPPSASSASGT